MNTEIYKDLPNKSYKSQSKINWSENPCGSVITKGSRVIMEYKKGGGEG